MNKALEKMRSVGILDKSYDDSQKNLYYNVKIKSVLIDLEKEKVSTS